MERRDAKRAEAAIRGVIREVSQEMNDLAHATIGAGIAVHRELGPGFLEQVYEEAMILELAVRNLRFERQVAVPVFYGERQVAESRLDLVVEKRLVVELKAVEQLRPVHRAQVISYLKAGGYELGLLMNFNVTKLLDGIQRIVLTL
jgi:GxxExxY protein